MTIPAKVEPGVRRQDPDTLRERTLTASGDGEEIQHQIIIPPEQVAGVWANWARVSHSEHEFTLDFVRLDYTGEGPGIVVARVSVSPLFVTQLIDALQVNWQSYAEKALPREVTDDDDDHGES